MQLTALL